MVTKIILLFILIMTFMITPSNAFGLPSLPFQEEVEDWSPLPSPEEVIDLGQQQLEIPPLQIPQQPQLQPQQQQGEEGEQQTELDTLVRSLDRENPSAVGDILGGIGCVLGSEGGPSGCVGGAKVGQYIGDTQQRKMHEKQEGECNAEYTGSYDGSSNCDRRVSPTDTNEYGDVKGENLMADDLMPVDTFDEGLTEDNLVDRDIISEGQSDEQTGQDLGFEGVENLQFEDQDSISSDGYLDLASQDVMNEGQSYEQIGQDQAEDVGQDNTVSEDEIEYPESEDSEIEDSGSEHEIEYPESEDSGSEHEIEYPESEDSGSEEYSESEE